MDHHAVAAISLAGISLDVVGGLYLAYDLLGGQHGPLRLLTRMVTYSIVFGVPYGLGLGPLFGILAGASTGITVAIELNRFASSGDHYPLWLETVFSAIRGAAFAAALYRDVGFPFAFTFGALITVGQVIAYTCGARPSLDYTAARTARFTRRHLGWALLRSVGYAASAMVCATLVRHVDHPWLFAAQLGVITGLVTSLGILLNPLIEYYADNLPQRRLGVFGILLVFCGFALQSVQYVVALMDAPVS
jgi:hypothetical protein